MPITSTETRLYPDASVTYTVDTGTYFILPEPSTTVAPPCSDYILQSELYRQQLVEAMRSTSMLRSSVLEPIKLTYGRIHIKQRRVTKKDNHKIITLLLEG